MKKILFILGIFLIVSCNQGNKKQSEGIEDSSQAELTQVKIQISGMHCDMCVASIEKGVGALDGIEFVKAELSDSSAVIKFHEAETNLAEIRTAIEKRGYTVKE